LSNPRLAIAAVVALVVLLVIGLAVAGVFGSSTPRRAATTVLTTHARTTTAATTAPPPPSSVTAAPSGPLKLGDSGAQVKVLQRALASLGYSPGAIDGNYGPSTQQAVARFQAAAKLTPDGILGPQTLQALKNALAGP
jgi:peptidoglycan hydrolase-like protein with peptidoglycan-binding domain